MSEENQNFVYVVVEMTGEYEDKCSNPIYAFTTEEAAKAYKKSLKEQLEIRDKLAIRDVYGEYEQENSSAYSDLLEKFQTDSLLKMFPHLKDAKYDCAYDLEEQLSDKEKEDYYDIYDSHEQEKLAEYMRDVCHYPEDVIKATIEYNYAYYDDRDPYYYVEKIPLKY